MSGIMINYYRMKCIPQFFRPREEGKQRAIKIMLAIKRLKRSNTGHSDISRQPNTNMKMCLPSVDVSRNFSSIYVRQKRDDYSGYKQTNANKSKSTKTVQSVPEKRKSVPSQYQINFKNIEKLRKRFSLDPSTPRLSSEIAEGCLEIPFKSAEKLQHCASEGPYEKKICELREKLKKANHQKCTQSSKSIIFNQSESNAVQEHSLNKILKNVRHKSSVLIAVEMELNEKPLARKQENEPRQFMPRFKKREKMRQKKETHKLLKNYISHRQQKRPNKQGDICGWSGESFYPNLKPKFFQDIS